MVQLADLPSANDHPITLELASLKSTVARFQDEAHVSSVKLQRRSLDVSRAHERVAHLEYENTGLRNELEVLRAHPHPDASPQSHSTNHHVQELTLALRRLSDKLSLTEDALLSRTTELTHAKSELVKAKLSVDSAYELSAQTRGREEAGKLRERELEWKLKTAEEQVNMSDTVLKEYADLVRSLESKILNNSQGFANPVGDSSDTLYESQANSPPNHYTKNTATLSIDSIAECKSRIKQLATDNQGEVERLHSRIDILEGELASYEARFGAEKKSSERDRKNSAKWQHQIEKQKLDDLSAAKMVSRYMKFSQKSTDNLQLALTSLKNRHAATIETLTSQILTLSSSLQAAEAMAERLRMALDELGGDLMKEAYGRRREIGLRLQFLNREEKVHEGLRRWIRRSEEALERMDEESSGYNYLLTMTQEARILLSSLEGPATDSLSLSGSLARLIAAQHAVANLEQELQTESSRRLALEMSLAHRDPMTTNNADQNVLRSSVVRHGEDDVVHMVSDFDSSRTLVPSLEDKNDVHMAEPDVESGISKSDDGTASNVSDDHSKYVSSGLTLSLPSESFSRSQPSQSPTDISADSEVHSNYSDEKQYSEPVITTHHALQPEIVSLDHVTEQAPEESTRLATVQVENSRDRVDSSALDHDDISEPPIRSTDLAAVHENVTPIVTIHLEKSEIKSSSELSNIVASIPTSPTVTQLVQYEEENGDDTAQLTPSHPLLTDLTRVGSRYDDLQRGFRDCHMTLQNLKESIVTNPDSIQHSPHVSNGVPSELLRMAIDRLNDYTEDARVELEIRISDEALLARGYETLLSIPGAIASSPPNLPSQLGDATPAGLGDKSPIEPTLTQVEIESHIETFISGNDAAIQRAQETFRSKLDDIQHDIAALKRAVHDPDILSSPGSNMPSTPKKENWKSWIRSPNYPSSLGASPTFGDIMTSPRLRNSPSLNFPRKGSMLGENRDPLASLGLRMPIHGIGLKPSHLESPATPRSRTVSTMYMLGIGARSASGGFNLSPVGRNVSFGGSPSIKSGEHVGIGDESSEIE